MADKVDFPEVEVARVAGQQHGIVTWGQLLASGLEKNAITRLRRRGVLHPLYRGVYAVGHAAPSDERRWMAAVLACGEGAVLSHAAAAALWRLLRPMPGPVDVSVPSQAGRARREGIRVHRCASLAVKTRGDTPVAVRAGIPVTAPWRTIEDLRGTVPSRLYRRAVREAELRGYALALRDRGDRTRSDLERDFLGFCRRHRIPAPEVNCRVGRREVDFLWRAERLVVETDGFRYHRGSVAFEDDHARDLELRLQGFAVRHFTGRQLAEEPGAVASDIREALLNSPA